MGSAVDELARWVLGRPRRRLTLLVGIDGPGGAGKTTLAEGIARRDPSVAVVHMDDFYWPSREQPPSPHGDAEGFDWHRLERQVLAPLAGDRESRYQRYEWGTDVLGEWRTIQPGGVVIVEGVSALRRELRLYYDGGAFVACPRHTRLARGLARDGEGARAVWLDQWMPAEDRYFARHSPQEGADVIVEGGRVRVP